METPFAAPRPSHRHQSIRLALPLIAATVAISCTPPDATSRNDANGTTTSVMTSRPVINIAHRGASAYAPEHTFASWDLALEMNADYLEQDLQMTADGVLMVMHDDTLDRTARGPASDCTGAVIEKGHAQLERCNAGAWFNEEHPDRARPEFVEQRIPTLESVFERYAGRARFYIETKNPEAAPGMEEELLRLLRAFDLVPASPDDDTVILQSFSPDSLLKLRDLEPSLPRVQLAPWRETSASIRSQLSEVAAYANGLGPHHSDVDQALLDDAHKRGLVVHPYTVDDPEEMRRLIGIGVDGMFTNVPDVLGAMLR